MAKVDELLVEIKGDTSDLVRSLEKARKETKDSTNDMSSGLNKLNDNIGKAAKGFGIFLAAVTAAKGAAELFNTVVEKANSSKGIQLMADRIGFTTQQFQRYANVARISGIDSEVMADAIKDLTVKIQDAALGATAYEDALKSVGLSSKDLVNLPVEKQFLAFADAIAKADDSMSRFALDEINDSMFQLLPLMKQGGDAIKGMAEDAARFDIPNEVLDDLEESRKKIEEMNIAWERMSTILISKISPYVTAISNAMTSALLPSGPGAGLSGNQPSSSGGVMIGQGMGMTVPDFNMPSLKGIFPTPDVSNQEASAQPLMMGVPEQGMLESEIERSQDFWTKLEEAEAESLERRRILEAQFLAESVLAEQQAAEEKRRADEAQKKAAIETAWTTQRKLASMMSSESRKMFEIGKAARIAEVAITTPKAAMDAYSAMASIPYVGPVLGAAAAAAAVAYGAQQIQQIQSTTFRGGSRGGGGGPAPVSAEGAGGGSDEVRNVTEANINIYGDNFSGDSVRGLLKELKDLQEDGGELVLK